TDVRPWVQATFAEHRARGTHTGRGKAQVRTGQQRIVDQLFQHRVIELRPPLDDGDAGGESVAGGVAQVHIRRDRRAVVGADGACRQGDGGGHGQCDRADHHGSVSPRWVNVPVGPSAPSSAISTLLLAPTPTSSSALGFMSVLMLPGWMALTLIPVSRSS